MESQEDVLIEILARLPVASLIRFTCVCKYWLSLIRSPEFATKHYTTRINSRKDQYDHDSLLSDFIPGLSFTIFSYENLSIKTVFKIRPAVPEPVSHLCICHYDIISYCVIYGPCNGLFLLTLRKADNDDRVGETVFLLWNPATREVFKLPDTDGIESWCAGLGFDDITNDYKVVNYDNTANSSIVQLYSLAANSWRQVDAGFYFGGGPPETYVSNPTSNGRMHSWILNYAVGYDLRCSLLSFDMADEVFVETPLPDETDRFSRGFLQQSSNDKYPTLYNFDDGSCTKGISIWVLQEYGPTGYWTRQHYITLPIGVSLGPGVVLWKNERILYINDRDPDDIMKWYRNQDEITLYNLRTQEKKSLHIPADRGIIGYTESLVSIAKCVRQQPLLPYDEQPEHMHGTGGVLQQEDSSLGMSLIPQQNDMLSGVQQENASLKMSLIQGQNDVPRGSKLHDSTLEMNLIQQQSDSSLEMTLTQQLNDVDMPRGVHQQEEHQENYSSSLEMAVQQSLPEGDELLHEDDEDDNNSSTDSAYFPHNRENQDPHSYWVDYTEDEIKYFDKYYDEIRRLSKLPYCIRELNQPISSKPCTF